jgi:hypothetical protein
MTTPWHSTTDQLPGIGQSVIVLDANLNPYSAWLECTEVDGSYYLRWTYVVTEVEGTMLRYPVKWWAKRPEEE